jgi:hypothetical protein
MAHYGMEPTTNSRGAAHENGDVEQAHFRFKQAVDQALRVRGSREFPDRAAYGRFLQELVRQRNLTRQGRFAEEQPHLRPLPRAPLALCREVRAPVSRGSTIRVLRNTYSVPARLIGTAVTVRVRAETLEVYHGTAHPLTIPRRLGERQHRIDYRHISASLVRKPGAFAQYRYRDDLFPTLTFRRTYDALVQAVPTAPTATTSACSTWPRAPARRRSKRCSPSCSGGTKPRPSTSSAIGRGCRRRRQCRNSPKRCSTSGSTTSCSPGR